MKTKQFPSSQQWLWAQRYHLFYQNTRIPIGFFSIYGELHGYIVFLEGQGYIFPQNRVPDISVGRCWCHYLKNTLKENLNNQKVFPEYPHRYPDHRGEQPARLYPNRLRGEFHNWLASTYLPEKLPEYIKKFSPPQDVALVCQIVEQMFLYDAA